MTKKKKKMTKMPATQFVRYSLDIMGPDGIEVQYPFGWVSAPKLASIETAADRMDYLMGLIEVRDDGITINGDINISRMDIDDGKFSTVDSLEIPDFTNGKEYFTDKQFTKLIEWCNEYIRQVSEGEQLDVSE